MLSKYFILDNKTRLKMKHVYSKTIKTFYLLLNVRHIDIYIIYNIFMFFLIDVMRCFIIMSVNFARSSISGAAFCLLMYPFYFPAVVLGSIMKGVTNILGG